MNPKQATAGLMLLGWLLIACSFLTSCVSIPIPPFGDQQGQLGNLQLSVSVKYLPLQNPDLPGNDNLAYAWGKFGQAKVLKDK